MKDKSLSHSDLWRRVISIFLVVLIIGLIAAIVYMVVAPKPGRAFTGFYILGMTGKAEKYPTQLTVGEKGQVIAGILNREQQTVTYRLEIVVDGSAQSTLDAITLEDGEEWRETVSFGLQRAGERQKVQFLLYRQGDSDPYREAFLWVDGR